MDHYNQLYANKLDEMDKFQDRHKLQNGTQGGKESLNR